VQVDLNGRVVLVTGASGGLGAHFAQVLARNGAHVVMAARRRGALEAGAQAIRDAGGKASVVQCDVTSVAAVEAAVTAVYAEVGGIDVLVNNSGIAKTHMAIDVTEPDWDQILDTNLKGPFLLSGAVARRWRDAKRRGNIVNIASITGLRQSVGILPYAVSKAGLIQMTKVMALEWARFGIRVNALAPGYVETDMNRDELASDAGVAMIRRIPQRAVGQPQDLDGALLLLVSDDSRYMTGSVLVIDGGHTVNTL
jgi:NAD(P)-dependent dehydrogenase (short-subunit alcohol dehydrogenase family)